LASRSFTLIHAQSHFNPGPAQKGGAKSVKQEVERVMIDSMSHVLDGAVPVAVEGAISARWSKG